VSEGESFVDIGGIVDRLCLNNVIYALTFV